jgi:hypothetical protein
MNYRRGFQRLYLVLAIAWIAAIPFAVLSGRWEPYSAQGSSVPAAPVYDDGKTVLAQLTDEQLQVYKELLLKKQAQALLEKNRLVRAQWLWTIGLSLLPPFLMYGLLFCIGPWVCRGFRPGAQI